MSSIRRQLLFGLVVGSIVLLGLAGATLYEYTRAILRTEFDGALRARALALVNLVKEQGGIVELEFEFADNLMPEFEGPEQPEYLQLWVADGTILARSHGLIEDLPRRTGPVDRPSFWDVLLPDGRTGRAIGIEFVPRSDPEVDVDPEDAQKIEGVRSPPGSPVSLVLARDRTGLDRSLASFRTTLIGVGVMFVAATALLVIVVAKRGLAPLARVADQAATIDTSSLQVRFPTGSLPRELRPISDRLNDLLARLEEAFQRERLFGANIAHELRTPIAELRSLAEVALKWPDETSYRASFEDALAIAHRMETLVAGLLTLARCEDGKQPVTVASVEVTELIEEVWSPLSERAERKQLAMARDIPSAFCLETDRALLRLILSNLLTNAVDHAPAGSQLGINLSLRNGRFDLTVANITDTLSQQDLPHLFERFWRKDAARTDSSHLGLGLSLARVSASVLGMTLSADMPDSTTLRLVLSGSHRPTN